MLDKIQMALSWNAAAYDAVRSFLRPGITEDCLFEVIEKSWHLSAGIPVPYAYDLVSGERSAEIGGEAGKRVIQAGDCVIADLLVACCGCWCDTTRTFFVGEPAADIRKAYIVLREAVRAGESVLRPGIEAGQIYEVVNSVLTSAGYPRLPHHAGHVVGKTQLDPPDFVQGSYETLREGMVVTLEPGIYFPGRNGMRLENNYLITASGCENLFPYPEEMENFIVGNCMEERNHSV